MSACNFCPECGQKIHYRPLETKAQLTTLLFAEGAHYVALGDVAGVFLGVARTGGDGRSFVIRVGTDDERTVEVPVQLRGYGD